MSSSSVHWRDVSGEEGRDRDAVTDGYIEVVARGREYIAGAGRVKMGKNEAGICNVGVAGLEGVKDSACIGEVDERRTVFGEY